VRAKTDRRALETNVVPCRRRCRSPVKPHQRCSCLPAALALQKPLILRPTFEQMQSAMGSIDNQSLRGIPTRPCVWIADLPARDRRNVLGRPSSRALGIESPSRGCIAASRSTTDLTTAYRAHLCLRTASRLQRVVAENSAAPDLETLRLQRLQKIGVGPALDSIAPAPFKRGPPALTDPQSQAMGETDGHRVPLLNRFDRRLTSPAPVF